jgi:uncharacterized membrane protein YidH (DUF202 family)
VSPSRPGPAGGSGAAGPVDDIEDRDPGLARERTDLAWVRTAISFSAVGAVIVRSSLVPGVIVLASGLMVWLLGRAAARATRHGAGGRWEHHDVLRLIATATTGLSVVVLVLALVLSPH